MVTWSIRVPDVSRREGLVTVGVAKGAEMTVTPLNVDDGFQMVKRTGIRSDPPTSRVVFTAGGSKDVLGKNNPEVQNRKVSDNTRVSNRFGSLNMETSSTTASEELRQLESDKENTRISNQNQKGKSAQQGSTAMMVRPSNDKGYVSEGPKERRNGGYKPKDSTGPKLKPKINMPSRGLVFGLTKGELALSESGKRLRVERDDA